MLLSNKNEPQTGIEVRGYLQIRKSEDDQVQDWTRHGWQWPNAQGKRHRSTEGAQGTNKGQDNGEALALVGVRLTAQLGSADSNSKCNTARNR